MLAATVALSSVVAVAPVKAKAEESIVSAKSLGIFNSMDQYSNVSTHTFVTKNGDVYITNFGELTPTKVADLSDVKQIFYNEQNTYALLNNGDIYSMGSGTNGKLGDGTTNTRLNSFKKVDGISNVESLVVSSTSIFAITVNKELYSWGMSGRTGHDGSSDIHVPTKIPGLSGVEKVFSNGEVTFVTLDNGEVYAWGISSVGALASGVQVSTFKTPTKINGLNNIKSIFLGNNPKSYFAVSKSGDVYSWGMSDKGVLGLGNVTSAFTPTKVNISNAKSLTVGPWNVYVVTNSGDAYTWGFGQHSLGLGHYNTVKTPTKIDSLSDIRAIIPTGRSAVFAITNTNDVYSWGGNESGQLGHGDKEPLLLPKKISELKDIDSINYSSNNSNGGESIMALSSSGEVFAMGLNNFGQLGLGNKLNYSTPQKLSLFTATEIEPEVPEAPSESEVNKDAGFTITNSGLHLEVDMQNLKPLINPENIASGSFAENIADIRSLIVKDFTGTNQGWSVYMSAKQIEEIAPKDGFKGGTVAIKFPIGVLSLESSLISSPIFNVNANLTSLDSGTPQKFAWAAPGAGSGENSLPSDGDFKIKVKNLSSVSKIVDPINYPDVATPYETTVNFTLVQGEL